MINSDDVFRLEEIKDEIKELLKEAEKIVEEAGGLTHDRAISYWIPHVEGALDEDHCWLGGSMVTMEDTIQELRDELFGAWQLELESKKN